MNQHRSSKSATVSIALAAALAWAGPIAAQIGGDPQTRVRDIARKVAEEMKEIDRLLLETTAKGRSASSAGAAADGMRRSVEQMRELLKQTSGSQSQTVEKLGELIKEIQDMAQSSGSPSEGESQGSPSSGQGQPRPDGQGQGRNNPRDQSNSPEFQRQQQGQSQGQEPGGQNQPNQPRPGDGDPQDGGENPDGGRNTNAGRNPDAGTERVNRESETGQWGNLPPYLQFLQGRGGAPEVPERYRKYVEVFMKKAQSNRK
jgi:hypothetical protein